MRAPPESLSPTTGQPILVARSMTLQIFCAYAPDREPPNTVKSWANTQTWRPSTVPCPVTTPSPRIFCSCMPKSAQRWVTNLSSSMKLPSSSSAAMRSRAVSLPASCCFTMRALPPASAALASISSRRRIGSWELTGATYRTGRCRSRDGERRAVAWPWAIRDDPAVGAVVEQDLRAVQVLEPLLEVHRDPADHRVRAPAGELERDRAV